MRITRSQRGERDDNLLGDQNTSEERLVEHEASGGDEQHFDAEIGFEETLYSVKEVLGEIKDDQNEFKELYQRITEENRALAERVERLESHDTVGFIGRQVDLETRVNNLEGKVEQLSVSSRAYKDLESQFEKLSAEMRRIYGHFSESFEGVLSAVEGLDKELQSAVAELQGKITDMTKICVPESPKAKSSERKPGGYDLSVDEKRGSSQRVVKGNLSLQRKQKPVQPAPKFNGQTTWEVFQAQFDIAAEMNGWQDDDKAVFLATALEGRAALVLGNLSEQERRHYKTLVTALTTRFGMAHQSELARAKLKCRSKSKEESMPELAESVQTLTRAAYPDASTELQDTIAKDNFIDALLDDDMRLKIRQTRPQSLQAALESALELESFQLASRHRNRVPRGSSWSVRKVDEVGSAENEEDSSIKRLEVMIDRLLQALAKKPRRQTPRRPASPQKCWSCGQPGHLRRNCPKEVEEKRSEAKEEENESLEEESQRRVDDQGNGERSAERGLGRPKKF